MPTLHYGGSEFTVTDDEVASLLNSGLHQPGHASVETRTGTITIVTGPGIPIWFDQRPRSKPRVLSV